MSSFCPSRCYVSGPCCSVHEGLRLHRETPSKLITRGGNFWNDFSTVCHNVLKDIVSRYRKSKTVRNEGEQTQLVQTKQQCDDWVSKRPPRETTLQMTEMCFSLELHGLRHVAFAGSHFWCCQVTRKIRVQVKHVIFFKGTLNTFISVII